MRKDVQRAPPPSASAEPRARTPSAEARQRSAASRRPAATSRDAGCCSQQLLELPPERRKLPSGSDQEPAAHGSDRRRNRLLLDRSRGGGNTPELRVERALVQRFTIHPQRFAAAGGRRHDLPRRSRLTPRKRAAVESGRRMSLPRDFWVLGPREYPRGTSDERHLPPPLGRRCRAQPSRTRRRRPARSAVTRGEPLDHSPSASGAHPEPRAARCSLVRAVAVEDEGARAPFGRGSHPARRSSSASVDSNSPHVKQVEPVNR